MPAITEASTSRVIISLPGVETSMRTGTVARVGADQLRVEASETSGRSVAATHVSEQRKREFEKDLEANAELVAGLKHLQVVPSPAGLDRIAAAALQFRGAFTNLVSATTAAALTLGRSSGANSLLVQSMQDFSQTAKLRATDQADMAYLMARIIVLSQKTEREQVFKAMEEALSQAKQQLVELEKQRDQLDHGGKVEVDGKMVSVEQVEKRAQLPGAKGESARHKLEEVKGVRSGLDKRIDALRDSIKALEKQLAGQQQQSGSSQLLNEVIFMLVEKAMSLARNPTGRQAAAPR